MCTEACAGEASRANTDKGSRGGQVECVQALVTPAGAAHTLVPRLGLRGGSARGQTPHQDSAFIPNVQRKSIIFVYVHVTLCPNGSEAFRTFLSPSGSPIFGAIKFVTEVLTRNTSGVWPRPFLSEASPAL